MTLELCPQDAELIPGQTAETQQATARISISSRINNGQPRFKELPFFFPIPIFHAYAACPASRGSRDLADRAVLPHGGNRIGAIEFGL
jgi:hypothetical protein